MKANETSVGFAPDINDFVRAVERLKQISRVAPAELRLHPEDYVKLRSLANNFLLYPAPGCSYEFSGLRIIVDPTATRLSERGAS